MENLDQAQEDTAGELSEEDKAAMAADELTSLKKRADLMGITYHPKIGVDTLRAKINEAVAAEGAPKETSIPAPSVLLVKPEPAVELAVGAPNQPAAATEETPGQKRQRMKREQLKLVRIRITCMNPAKKEWEGEMISAGNSLIGTVTKFIPFGADDGWHVPNIIYKVLKDRMCQIFVTVTDDRKQKVRKGKLIREFAIEVMDPLTPAELKELADRQAATRAIDN